MEFDNSFDVPLTPTQAWALLMDIPRIAPCMPGAELTQVVDLKNYRGKIAVRLGPVALTFAGRVELIEIDAAARTATVKAQGDDAKGRGSAYATAQFRIDPAGSGAKVVIHTDLMLSGSVAQYGRGIGMIQATAAQIIGQFATNLRTQLGRQPAAVSRPAALPAQPQALSPPLQPQTPSPPLQPQAPPARVPPAAAPRVTAPSPQTQSRPSMPPLPPAAKPISGLSLIARVVWQQIAGLFTRRRG